MDEFTVSLWFKAEAGDGEQGLESNGWHCDNEGQYQSSILLLYENGKISASQQTKADSSLIAGDTVDDIPVSGSS